MIAKPRCLRDPCPLCLEHADDPMHRPLDIGRGTEILRHLKKVWQDGTIYGIERGDGTIPYLAFRIRAGYRSHGWSSSESPFPQRHWRLESAAVNALLDLHRQWYLGELPGYPDDAELWQRFRLIEDPLRARAEAIDAVAPGRESRAGGGPPPGVPYWISLELCDSDRHLFEAWVDGALRGFPHDDESLLAAQAAAEIELRDRPIPGPAPPPNPPPTLGEIWKQMHPQTRAAVQSLYGNRPPLAVDGYEVENALRQALDDGDIPAGEGGDEEEYYREFDLAYMSRAIKNPRWWPVNSPPL